MLRASRIKVAPHLDLMRWSSIFVGKANEVIRLPMIEETLLLLLLLLLENTNSQFVLRLILSYIKSPNCSQCFIISEFISLTASQIQISLLFKLTLKMNYFCQLLVAIEIKIVGVILNIQQVSS